MPNYRRLTLALSLAGAALGLTSCDDGPNGNGECTTIRDAFVQQAWQPVLGSTCISCHQPGGAAYQAEARFRLVPASYPGFVDLNLAAVRELAGYEYEGVPLLLAKPSGRVSHGGGNVLDPSSAQYREFQAFLTRLREEGDARTCPASDSAFAEVDVLTPVETLRKSALDLVGRLPTTAEVEAVQSGGEPALERALLAMMAEPAFDTRLMEVWNDVLLTDQFNSYTGRSLQTLNEDDFPAAHDAAYMGADDAARARISRAVTAEPLQLIAHIVREGRPFSEILTANYSVYNPDSAAIYRVTIPFADPNNASDWREGRLSFTRDGETIPWQHAGILSSPMVLNRFGTTPTNLNRHRVWWLLRTFLATDILTVADRPIDPEAANGYDYPVRQDPQCIVCHAVLDPMAGAYAGYDVYDQERFYPNRRPNGNVFDPGFDEERMPANPEGGRLPWLAARIARDSRFPLAITRLTYTAFIGRAPIEHPRDPSAPNYEAQRTAWAAQDAVFNDLVQAFEASNQDYRRLVVALMLSPYYRASNVFGEVSGARAIELGEVGTARFLTPEMLSRKIHAVTGIHWDRGWDRNEQLTTDFDILYGGIDSDLVTDRLHDPNGVMAAVGLRMANEVSCRSTAYDFSLPVAQRSLFPDVELTTMPLAMDGSPDAAGATAVRAAIVRLHARFFGETLSSTDPEIERTYQLFVDTMRAGRAAITADTENSWLTWSCQARVNPATGEDLPMSQRIDQDPQYVIRSWMAVVTYLLSDYRFLHD
jgi:mono/diheme cytochrome c family protein